MKLLRAAAFALAATVITTTATFAQDSAAVVSAVDISDSALVKTLPGFEEGTVIANRVKLHYVRGGSGTPVLLLPGWPQTW